MKTYKERSFPGRGVERLTDEQREINNLKKALKDKELDLKILKKAISYYCECTGFTHNCCQVYARDVT